MIDDKKYLLDTNICVALLRGNRTIADKLIELGEGRCSLSVITVYELMFGAYYSMHETREIVKVKQFVERFGIVSLLDAAEVYAKEKTRLRRMGIMIDEFDLLIAATALQGDYILVTDNLRHFQRIENWIEH